MLESIKCSMGGAYYVRGDGSTQMQTPRRHWLRRALMPPL